MQGLTTLYRMFKRLPIQGGINHLINIREVQNNG